MRTASRCAVAFALSTASRTRPRRGSRSSRADERLALARAQQPARLALAGERPVDAAERLEPDEVAQHEHVERDLQPQLLLDLASPSAHACPTCSPGRSRARRTGRRRCGRSSPTASGRRRDRARAAAPAARARCRTRPRTGAARASSSLAHSSWTTASRSRQSVESSSRASMSVISMRWPWSASSRHARIRRTARRRRLRSSSFSTPSSFGTRVKNLKSAECATEPLSFASTSASIERGSRNRSTNHADEQSANRSSSVTLNVVFEPSCSSTSGCVSFVGRRNARRARSSRRSQPFARASASAPARRATRARRARAGARARSARPRAST